MSSSTSKLLAANPFGSGFEPAASAFSKGSDTTGAAAAGNLEKLISNILGALTVVGGLLFIVYFVLGAFAWLTAGSDASKVQKGRDKMVFAAMGLIVLVMSYGLIGLIGSVIGLDLLNPADVIVNQLDPR
jgi:hypothetical protein